MKMTLRGGIALAACLLGILAQAAPARAVEPKLLPNSTEAVIILNLRQLLNSAVAQEYKEIVEFGKGQFRDALKDKGADRYLDNAELDLFRDVKTVVVASDGSKDPRKGVIIVEGTFKSDKLLRSIEDAANEKKQAFKSHTLSGVKVLEFSPKDEETVFIGCLSDKILLAATSEEAFNDTIARSTGAKKSEHKKDFLALLSTVTDKQTLGIVATGPALSRMVADAPVPNAEAAALALQAIDGLSVAITVQKDISFQLGINGRDAQAAEQTAKTLNGGLLIAKLAANKKAKEDPNVAPVADIAKTLRVDTQGNTVILRGEISFNNLAVLLKNLPIKGLQ